MPRIGRNQITGRDRTPLGISPFDRGRNGAGFVPAGPKLAGLRTAVAGAPRLEPISGRFVRASTGRVPPNRLLARQNVVFSLRWSRRLIDLTSTRRTWLSCSTSSGDGGAGGALRPDLAVEIGQALGRLAVDADDRRRRA